jgi:hypothetical protein
MDLGCGKDLIPKRLVEEHEDLLVDADPIKFHTANGHHNATRTLP